MVPAILTPEELAALNADKTAADAALAQHEQHKASLQSRLDAIAPKMQDGDYFTTLPNPVPVVRKVNGKVEMGTIDPLGGV